MGKLSAVLAFALLLAMTVAETEERPTASLATYTLSLRCFNLSRGGTFHYVSQLGGVILVVLVLPFIYFMWIKQNTDYMPNSAWKVKVH